MERKSSSTTVVTAEQVAAGLKTARTSAREDQALRMRYGVGVDRHAALPQAHGGDVAMADELLLIEMQLLRSMKARQGVAKQPGTKSKIVARLSKK